MAPVQPREDHTELSTSSNTSQSTWIIIAVSALAFTLAIICVWLIVALRLKHQKYISIKKQSPDNITEKPHEGRKMSASTDRSLQDEERNQGIRVTPPSSDELSHALLAQHKSAVTVKTSPVDGRHRGVREDWKLWEAQLHRQKSRSITRHPVLLDQNPTLPQYPYPLSVETDMSRFEHMS